MVKIYLTTIPSGITTNLDYSRIKNATDARRRRMKLYSCTANASQQSRWGIIDSPPWGKKC